MNLSVNNDLLRLPQVLEIVPVSRSAWYAGVKKGVYPASVKIGLRATAWRRRDLEALTSRFGNVWDERALSHSAGEQA